MGEVLKRIRLPAEVQAWEKHLKLKKWVDGSGWNPEPRYAVVDAARGCWEQMGRPEFGDDPEAIVGSIYQYLVQDQGFISFVIEQRDQVVTDPAEWDEIAKAYAWVILQRYNRDLEQGGAQ